METPFVQKGFLPYKRRGEKEIFEGLVLTQVAVCCIDSILWCFEHTTVPVLCPSQYSSTEVMHAFDVDGHILCLIFVLQLCFVCVSG